MAVFALVDCNNFYASCERMFNPKLENQPIVVLSNNDGCVIARSNEAKKSGVPMGAPFFQFKAFFKSNNIHIHSSNYELYGDLSARVMTTLGGMCPELEIYSIDEAFLQLDSFEHFGIFDYSVKIKKQVKQWTGIPVSIGIAPTKTLSKIANHIAKKETTLGVFDLRDEQEREKILARFPVEDIWGIGRKLSKKLTDIGIHTAKDLRDSDPKSLRKVYSVLLERMIYELRGEACIQLEEMQPKKQIMSSRSFGRPVTNKIELEQAVAHHVTKAAGKLRRQNCRASGLYFFLHTNPYKLNSKQYANSISYRFPEHTNDTGLMIENAMACLNHLYKAGYEYHKCGVMLLDLVPNEILQQDLFLQDEQASTSRRKLLMEALDKTNAKFGRGTLRFGSEGFNHKWALRANYLSPRYTTRIDEIYQVLCK